jgi:hypothetical protein
MVKMMPAVTKPVYEWTAEERMSVMLNRYEWIQKCLDYFEEDKKNRMLLNFIKSEEKN